MLKGFVSLLLIATVVAGTFNSWSEFIPSHKSVGDYSHRPVEPFCYLCQEPLVSDAQSNATFPPGMIFSVATAAYQVEGAWDEGGKAESIWDRLLHTHPSFTLDHKNGDVACDSYHLFKTDIDLIKGLGFKMYRFSISWPRVLPTGDITEPNEEGINYYMALIDQLLGQDIEPMITLYHWDLPQKLQDIGGWLNPATADYFQEYAALMFKTFGSKVKWWITINEPGEIVRGYSKKDYAPALNLEGSEYAVGHNLLIAHAKAYRIYEKEFKSEQKGKVSFALSGAFGMPVSKKPEDCMAAYRFNQFNLGWFAHPVYSKYGGYPPIMREMVDKFSTIEDRDKSRLPVFSIAEEMLVKGSYDFFGLNHYTSVLCSPEEVTNPRPEWESDMRLSRSFDPTWPSSGSPWLKVVPCGFRGVLGWLKNEYGEQDFFITENGYSDYNLTNDIDRMHYHKRYLEEMSKAINQDKVSVIGYTVWSLLDNFEWKDGYTKKFGLYEVNMVHPDRPRTAKKSAQFFQKLLASRHIPDTNDF